jgi:hypothetical protein
MNNLKTAPVCQANSCERCSCFDGVQDRVCSSCLASQALFDAIVALKAIPASDRWEVLREVARMEREEKARKDYEARLLAQQAVHQVCECCLDPIDDGFSKLCSHCASLTPAQLELALAAGCPF